jgi:transcriptional regulator with XRE-family HTH domain
MFSDFLQSELDSGKTLQELAEIIDVSYQTIQCYIKKGNYPTVTKLMKFAEYYNLSIDYLLGYIDEKKPLFQDEKEGD